MTPFATALFFVASIAVWELVAKPLLLNEDRNEH